MIDLRYPLSPAWTLVMRRHKWLMMYAAVAIALLVVCQFSPLTKGAMFQALGALDAELKSNFIQVASLLFLGSGVLAFLAFPSMPLIYVAAGYMLPAFHGSAIVLLGSVLGGLGAFLLYRRNIPRRLRLPRHECSAAKMWFALLGLRLSPIVPASMVNIVAAVSDVSVLSYVSTTLVGSAPLIAFYEAIGHEGRHFAYDGQISFLQALAYVSVLTFSTCLSALAPWRSFLRTVEGLTHDFPGSLKKLPGFDAFRPRPRDIQA